MIFVAKGAFAQFKRAPKDTLLLLQYAHKPLFNTSIKPTKTTTVSFLPVDFYSKQLGFFCKQEIKFEKLTGIPFRFRLGSIEACDRLEGKVRRN